MYLKILSTIFIIVWFLFLFYMYFHDGRKSIKKDITEEGKKYLDILEVWLLISPIVLGGVFRILWDIDY